MKMILGYAGLALGVMAALAGIATASRGIPFGWVGVVLAVPLVYAGFAQLRVPTIAAPPTDEA